MFKTLYLVVEVWIWLRLTFQFWKFLTFLHFLRFLVIVLVWHRLQVCVVHSISIWVFFGLLSRLCHNCILLLHQIFLVFQVNISGHRSNLGWVFAATSSLAILCLNSAWRLSITCVGLLSAHLSAQFLLRLLQRNAFGPICLPFGVILSKTRVWPCSLCWVETLSAQRKQWAVSGDQWVDNAEAVNCDYTHLTRWVD